MDAVRVEGLTKRFGPVVAVDSVTLEVRGGEILSLLGPSGCGKTTFLRLIAGFERPDAGTIHIAGAPVTTVPPERRRVGFMFQDYALFPHMTVEQNVAFGVERRRRADRSREVLHLVGLSGLEQRYPYELSGGQQQRVALARALAPSPALILMDEPFSNLDADLRARVREEVRDILRTAGATTVFVTHDQEEAFGIADRIAVMNDGRIEQVDRPELVYHTPATRFVADFVGEADLLPVEVRENSVVTELGTFPAGDTSPGSAEIMVRPEDIHLTPGGDSRVVARRFQGAISLTTVRLPSGRTVTAALSSQDLYEPDEQVRPTFTPDHVVLFRGQERIALVHIHGPRTGHR